MLNRSNRRSSSIAGFAVFAILLSLVSLLFLSACSSGASSSESSSEEQAAEKYKLDISIECRKNLLLSRYDLNIFIDGEQIGSMDHGAIKSLQVDLSEGKHTFKVAKKGSSGVDGSADFDMAAEESVLACKLHCTSDQVEIEDFSAKTQKQAAADEEAAKAAEEEAAKKKAAEEEAEEKRKAEEKAAKEQKEAEEKAAREQKEAERKAEEEKIAAGPVSEITAEQLVDDYGDWVYPYGFKLHYLTGVLAAERQDDGSMFLKIYCDVKNAYGTWAKNLVCEAYVGGTEGDPKILGFNVY